MKHRKLAATGKGRYFDRYVGLPHYMLRSDAWLDLSSDAKAILIDVWQRHNGVNNGGISYSVREAAEIKISKSGAARALRELVDHGFLVVEKEGSFKVKTTSPAREWRITAEPSGPVQERKATKDFMRWSATAKRTSNPETRSLPRDRPVPAVGHPSAGERILPVTVPPEGPRGIRNTPSRSLPGDTSILPGEGGSTRPAGGVVSSTEFFIAAKQRKPLASDGVA